MRVKDDYTPSLYNDPKLVERVSALLRKEFGDSEDRDCAAHHGRRGLLPLRPHRRQDPRHADVARRREPGTYDASRKPGGKPLPSLHSSEFAPDPDPTIATGVKAMTVAAMDLLK